MGQVKPLPLRQAAAPYLIKALSCFSSQRPESQARRAPPPTARGPSPTSASGFSLLCHQPLPFLGSILCVQLGHDLSQPPVIPGQALSLADAWRSPARGQAAVLWTGSCSGLRLQSGASGLERSSSSASGHHSPPALSPPLNPRLTTSHFPRTPHVHSLHHGLSLQLKKEVAYCPSRRSVPGRPPTVSLLSSMAASGDLGKPRWCGANVLGSILVPRG